MHALSEDDVGLRIAKSKSDQLNRRLYRQMNATIQELVFDNRCMGHVLDMAHILPYWHGPLSEDSSVRDIKRTIERVRDTGTNLKEQFFSSHPEEVASDKFIQDHYFDWLFATGRHAKLLSYSGPLVVPESLEYYKGLALLRRGRVAAAARHFAESFSISLVKQVRELRKDKNITVLLSKANRSLLAHMILRVLDAHRKREALSVIDVPLMPGFDALVFYRMKALVALGRKDDARVLYDDYIEASQGAPSAAPEPGMSGQVLLLVIGYYRRLLRRYAKTVG
jgi:hypothetical protein